MKVLVTCPPMLGMIDRYRSIFTQYGIELTTPNVLQTLTVDELKEIVPLHDGWIIGDDPATKSVFIAGKEGRLKGAVKWGIGVDNVDFEACKELGIPIVNTPNMFGGEVADMAMGYLIALARETFEIDRGVRQGLWPKPCGISLAGKTVALVGYGDIGQSLAKRMLAADMKVVAYDPGVEFANSLSVQMAPWPERIKEADFIVVTCALTASSYHLINKPVLDEVKAEVRIVNVARGPVIDEEALVAALQRGQVHSVALDVFEVEPVPKGSYLTQHPRCILGSHNASNTVDAVDRTSKLAINKLLVMLGILE